MKTVILLVAMSVMGAAVRSEGSCYRKDHRDSGKLGCLYNPLNPSVLPRTTDKETTFWFAEEQGDGYCLYRKTELSKTKLTPRLRVYLSRISYELAPISTVEQIESQGSRAIAKSVTAGDVLSVLHGEGVTDIFQALHVSEALDYVLSGNVAIKQQRTCSTFKRPLIGGKSVGPVCSMMVDNDPSSVLLGKIVKGIIKAAEASEDSVSCAKQSQI